MDIYSALQRKKGETCQNLLTNPFPSQPSLRDKHGNEKTYKKRAPSIKILEMQRAEMNFIFTHQK